jgi:FAD dependent oxidoreductase
MTDDHHDGATTAVAARRRPGAVRGPVVPPRSRLRHRATVGLAMSMAVLLVASAQAVTTPASAAGPGGVRVNRDVVVYGGTPAGVAAAIAAHRTGARVTLLAEGKTVGGTMSNGISASDIGSAAAVSGLADEFFDRIRTYYKGRSTWRFEPRVAERVLRRMLAGKVQVRYYAPVVRVVTTGNRITCVVVPTERSYCAKSFIDASYTGDVLVAAGVPHRLGMADLMAYGESLAEARRWKDVVALPAGQEGAAAAAFAGNPFMRPAATLPAYRDAYAQGMPSLTYRLCVTAKAANKVPFRASADYATLLPSFRILAQGIRPFVSRKSNGTLYSDVYQLATLPGGKYDLNSGYRSFTNVPAPQSYFDSRDHRRYWNGVLRRYVESFFYFVQHDASVPAVVRTEFARFGLCKDEFADNGNWPREPYVREAVRIKGRYTMTQADIFTTRTKPDSIALGSYNVDSKASQWKVVDGTLYRDMSVHSTAPVYEIPYRALVPGARIVNVLAPVGVSASSVAYGSLRMEPQYMVMGQAAGIAAALGAKRNRTLTDGVPASWVQRRLRADRVLYKALDVCRRTSAAWRPAGGYDTGCSRVLPVGPKVV